MRFFKAKNLLFFSFLGFFGGVFFLSIQKGFNSTKRDVEKAIHQPEIIEAKMPSITPTPSLPLTKVISNDYHVIQSFNNCGPASLSMGLSYVGVNKSQEELGNLLRPYQVPGGDNDDKSVTLDELAQQAEKYDLIAYHRPNGTINLVKRFIAADIPIIVRTWLHPDDDIGHYRVIKGYDENTKEVIQDDSYEGHNLRYSYETFLDIWDKYNYEYLVIVPLEKKDLAEKILGPDLDEKTSWKHAVTLSQKALSKNPDNTYARFNLSVAYYNIGDYKNSVVEFEKIESSLPFRTLWYQIEPIMALYNIGNYEKVFSLTDSLLNNQNRAFSELYIIRGNIYKKQGNTTAAKEEYEKAVYYNNQLKQAQDALSSI